MRSTLMEERMSAAEFDRSLSFQAAEAALREGESVAASKPMPTGPGCTNGICAKPLPGDVPRWLDTDANWVANSRAVALTDVGTLTANPRFIVELMADDAHGSACTTSGDMSPDAACSDVENRYRVTARSQQAGRADVVLQSIYAAP
jgi:type IV pilus assembly protein PilX